MMLNTDGRHKAAWGKLCAKIIEELTSGFKEVDVGLYKLSAFIPVCKAQLDLGPEWLDRYIRAILAEALANGLEDGIVMGDGNDKPIGMIRDVSESASVVGGAYPEKAKIKVSDFEPTTMGKLVALLAVNPNGKDRNPDDLILLAIKKAALSGVRKWNYINGILKSWKNEGVKTLGDVQARDQRRKPPAGQQPKRSAADDYDEIFGELLGGSKT